MGAEKLKDRDYVVVIDKSGSMETKDTPTGQSRWDYAKESTQAISRKLNEYDPDGCTIIPFAGSFKVYENTTPEKVDDIFAENSPMGGTVLAPVLENVFANFLKRKAANQVKANGEIMVVVTDGQPQDEAAVSTSIINFTKKLENGDGEYGIAFVQVGKDSGATSFLKRLDDELTTKGAKFDIVDTKTMDEVENLGLTETLIAALED